MKKSKKFIALAIVLTMFVVLVAACGTNEPITPTEPTGPAAPPTATGPTEGGGMVGGVDDVDEDAVFAEHIDIIIDNNNIAVVNPFNPAANPTSTNWTFVMIHDRLVERDHETGEFVASLAHDWATEDFQTFTFYLRDDVVFHNGQRFTADDVVFTIEYAREHGAGSPAASQWAPVSQVRAIDDTTVELTLSGVFVDFLHNVSVPSASIVSRSALAADADTGTHIGTGPYHVIEFVSNDFLRMGRNHNFWNERFNIVTEYVTLRFVPEMSARTIRMQRGESQLSFGTSADDLPLFQDDPDNFQVIPQTFNNVQGFSFNMRDPLLQCLYLRLALIHATNREEATVFAASEWAAAINDNNGGDAVWGFATDFRNNNLPARQFDLDLARYYLEKSEYNGEELEIAVAIITNIRAAQALQQQWSQIGVNTRINEMDSPGLSAYMLAPDTPSQIVVFNLATGLSATVMMNSFMPDGVQNRMGFNNPEVTELFLQGGAEFDPNVRRDIYYRIQELVYEDPPFLNVFWRINGTVAAYGLGGIRLPSDNLQNDFREVFMVIG